MTRHRTRAFSALLVATVLVAHACRQQHGVLIPRIDDIRKVLYGATLADVDLVIAPSSAVPLQASWLQAESPGGSSLVQNSHLRI